MHVTWAQKLKIDTLQASSNSELSLTLSYIAEVRDEHNSGLKFTQLVGRPLRVIRRESNVDVSSLFRCLVLIRVTWERILSTSAFECGKDRRDLTKYPNVGNLISPHPSVNRISSWESTAASGL